MSEWGDVHDLIVSRPTFERDFDYHYATLMSVFGRLKNCDYSTFEENLIKSAKKHSNGVRTGCSAYRMVHWFLNLCPKTLSR